MSVHILQGDCREVMSEMDGASVEAIVCDPPYELGFMGKGWDATGVANDPATWRAALGVLKPGGHLLAFSGTRTYHRMVCAIEDAGFEIRDQIGWLYGSGFPKSLDVSKAIDKAAGAVREITRAATAEYRAGTNVDWDSRGSEQREQPATADAATWQGWGTALKPAWEPIVMARKPLIGTVAANVLAHGCGALNIDGCRVAGADDTARPNGANVLGVMNDDAWQPKRGVGGGSSLGRWPANIIHDGSDEVLAAFPDTGPSPRQYTKKKAGWLTPGSTHVENDLQSREFGDTGSAARFFYTAKASRHDRNDGCYSLPKKPLNWSSGEQSPGTFQAAGTDRGAHNAHPTVKPTDLMRYLCRLVTPPGGTILDPFMGSGSTLKAAELEGFNAIGIELDPTYIEIARRRIASDAPLFAETL